jgi:hypothetical protein
MRWGRPGIVGIITCSELTPAAPAQGRMCLVPCAAVLSDDMPSSGMVSTRLAKRGSPE